MLKHEPRRATVRQCGDCTLCCKLIPVKELDKPRSVWCQHCEPGKGCMIYEKRPEECRNWSCQWLYDGEMPEEIQPHKVKCVFDTLLDHVRVENNEWRPVFQLWVDPSYPAAYRQKRIRDQVERLGALYGCPTVARIGYRAILLLPESVTGRDFEERATVLLPVEEWDRDDWQTAHYEASLKR